MKLSISNIAWPNEKDFEMYEYLYKQNFNGIEIAPTRIFPELPYNKLNEAKKFSQIMKNRYNLTISSLQSIWYGKNERIFGNADERKKLLDYTKEAVMFAEIINCGNIVFGCPKNRVINDKNDLYIAIEFFKELGQFALQHGTIISLEANPTIYNTNFINTTQESFDFVKEVASDGFKVNLDMGTMIFNNESIEIIADHLDYINHIHISEPELKVIKKRRIFGELNSLLKSFDYDRYISVEMGLQTDFNIIKNTVKYIKEIFEC